MTKDIVILGGTGTLGSAVIAELVKDPDNYVHCFSRDEHKQKQLEERFPQVNFILGDIRHTDSLRVLKNVHTVFHFAALKHIDKMEMSVDECIKTNLIGSILVSNACEDYSVEHCVFSSTDKAIFPINTYGYSKALAEKYMRLKNGICDTRFMIYRWGNIIGSNGSVIPQLITKIKNNAPVTITHKEMTRFWLPLSKAVKFMLSTYETCDSFQDQVPPGIKSAYLTSVVRILSKMINGHDNVEMKIIGLRPGEKLHENMSVSDPSFVSNSEKYLMSDHELMELLEPEVQKWL